MNQEFKITSKITHFIKRLKIMYGMQKNESPLLYEIINKASIFVQESFDEQLNREHEAYAHNIFLFLNEEEISKINDLDTEEDLCKKIRDDLNQLARYIPYEYISSVIIELADDSNLDYKSSIKPSAQPVNNLDYLSIWKEPKYTKLFISHRDRYKKEASALAGLLSEYGITSFVAHDTIEPLDKWQHTMVTLP